jgi:hypothetical protein
MESFRVISAAGILPVQSLAALCLAPLLLQSLYVTPAKPFILYFPERLPAIHLEGLPASDVAYRLDKSQTENSPSLYNIMPT